RVLQLPRGVENGLVFDLTGNDVPAANATGLGDAFEGEVVGLGGTGGPDNLLRLRADQIGYLPTRLLDRLPGLLAESVGAGRRVTEVTVKTQTFDHHLDDPLVHRGGGGVIEIQRTCVHKGL